MTKLECYFNMHYADDDFCKGAIRAAIEDCLEGDTSTAQLVTFFRSVATGRGCDVGEVLSLAERPAMVIGPDRWAVIRASLRAEEDGRPPQEREDAKLLMLLIRSMIDAHAVGLEPDEKCTFLPSLRSPCGLLMLLDHWYGRPGDADTAYELRMVDDVIFYYNRLLEQAAKSNGLTSDALEALYRRNFRTPDSRRMLTGEPSPTASVN